MPMEDDDPVIASYDVYISPPTRSTSTGQNSSELYMLQYPSHRPSNKPYSTSRSQKPSFVRLKPNTGIIELDVPIMTSDNYNYPLGTQFGKAIQESQLSHPNSTHGLSGGFSHNQSSNAPINLADVPQHGTTDPSLHVQTLGGKISTSTDKDPIYMLATLRRNSRELHLQHLDAVVQLRPQLHHIDAAEEIKKRIETTATRAKAAAAVDPSAPVKLETKAIELKLKDNSKDDPKDRHQNENAKLLREIQNDPWVRYEWIESGSTTLQTASTDDNLARSKLRATMDNDEWLNKMSSPGIELRTRLKGRDRERARRKRQERARAARGEVAAAAVLREQEEVNGNTASESDVSDEDEMDDDIDDDMDEDDDVDGDHDGALDVGESSTNRPAATTTMKKRRTGSDAVRDEASSPEVQIKQEASMPTPSAIPASSAESATTTAVPKRRGRPPKAKAG